MENFNTRLQDRTIRHSLYLEGLKNSKAKEIIRFIDTEIIPDLLAQLQLRLSSIEEFGFDKGAQTTARIERMLNEFKFITDRFKNYQPDFFDLLDSELKWNIGAIIEEAGFQLGLTLPAIEQIQTAVFSKPFDGRTLDEWFNRLSSNLQDKLSVTVKRGVVEGQTTGQIVKAVKGSKKLNYTDGILNITRKQAEAVVRTGVAHIANSARDEVFKANTDIIKGVQWVATLDSRTCLQCAPLDGKVFKVNEGVRPPLHVSCRCVVSAVLKGDNSEQGKRASMNGQFAADINYNDWLKKQSLEVQEMALGKTKAQLFRKGGLNIDQFVTNNRHELTLSELRVLEQQAFKKAGL